MSQRVTIVSSQVLAQSWGRLTDYTIDYTRKNGTVQRFRREVYDHGSAAAVLLHDKARDTVLLVRQFRYPALINGDAPDLLEACAGLLDDDDAMTAAAREALEETGHAPRDLTHICDAYMSPGSLTEKVSFFVGAYDATTFRHDGGGIEDEGEEIELVELPFAEALAMTRDGRIIDAKTIILIQHVALARVG